MIGINLAPKLNCGVRGSGKNKTGTYDRSKLLSKRRKRNNELQTTTKENPFAR